MFHFKNVRCHLVFDSVGGKKNTKVVALNAFHELSNKQEKSNYNNHLFFIQWNEFDMISALFVDNC